MHPVRQSGVQEVTFCLFVFVVRFVLYFGALFFLLALIKYGTPSSFQQRLNHNNVTLSLVVSLILGT